MYKIFCVIIFFLTASNSISAQILPEEGSQLCYRIIGFAFPSEKETHSYKIEIAAGIYYSVDSFEKNVIISIASKENKKIVEVPSFGRQYTWRSVSVACNNTKIKTSLHHFSTKIFQNVDSTVMRLRVVKNARKYKDSYVFLDGIKVLYNMQGEPVWFLPGAELPVNQNVNTRDMKITPQGTITFLTGFGPYEIDYKARILWQDKGDPASHKANIFHHEFTRLRDGHYMGMVSETAFVRVPEFKDKIAHSALDSARYYYSANFTNLIEFDANDHVVWRWSDWNYINQNNLFLRKDINGRYVNLHKDTLYDGRQVDIDLHENSFYFDEKNKNIYLSFRNTDDIIKIKYPGGNVLNVYGPAPEQGITDRKNELFCGQHSCKISHQGYLYLFNNNTCGASHAPTIVIMEQPASGKGSLKKIWEYQCTIEDSTISASKNLSFLSAGDVTELPDQSMFVAMSKPYCKIFIVSHNKEVLWSAMPEQYNKEEKKWEQVNLYRASIISNRKDLDQLIWNAEKK